MPGVGAKPGEPDRLEGAEPITENRLTDAQLVVHAIEARLRAVCLRFELANRPTKENPAFGGSVVAGPDQPTLLGSYKLNTVTEGDCHALVQALPDSSIDVVVTSPPYWGQRLSNGIGNEEDPRDYVLRLADVFGRLLPKLKQSAIVWLNMGDAYNTPVNWRETDHVYSSLGPQKRGLSPQNSAYVKPRARRKAFIDPSVRWLVYGNLLALPFRLIIELCDRGYLYRGEVIWHKMNPMPEGRCRRPHRHHESIYLLAKSEKHAFRSQPPVGSIWEFGNEQVDGPAHYSRFPLELPKRCIEAYGAVGPNVVVLDPFSGSGTTGLAALLLGCSFIGFEIDREQVESSNSRLRGVLAADESMLFPRERQETEHGGPEQSGLQETLQF